METRVLGRVPAGPGGLYPGNRARLAPLAMLRLPIGAVRAEGWLAGQLDLMRDGMVGRLAELSDFLRPDNGWFGGSNPGWEEQPYWLRGFYPLGVLTGDERIRAEGLRWIEAVIGSRQPDGYFGAACHKAVAGSHGEMLPDLWPHMVMLDALVLHHEATGDPRVLELARAFCEWCRALPDGQFIPRLRGDLWQSWREEFGTWKIGVQVKRAGDMIPHIHWLYGLSGEPWLLDLATRFHGSTLPPMSEWLDDHVVNFTQRFAYPAIYGRQDDPEAGLAESEYWYAQHMATWGQQPRGVFGADERIRPGKTDPRQGFETCAMVEFAKQYYHLGRMTGLPLYADRVEDVMLNHFPASQTPDLKGLHYLTASNMPQLDCGDDHDFYNKRRQLNYSPHDYRCCRHNVAMGWPWYVQNLWQATAEGGLAAWLYGASRVTARVGDGSATASLRQVTGYPFEGSVRLEVLQESEKASFPLYLRVPGWCRGFSVRVNGRGVAAAPPPAGVLEIRRTWSPGDVVEIDMPMSMDSTRWPHTGSLTVDRGPLSYSIAVPEEWRRCGGTDDWPEWEVLPAGPWNYGLIAGTEPEVTELRPVTGQPWTLESAPIELEVKARRIPGWRIDQTGTVGEVPRHPVRSEESVEMVRLVPMGCARLRMACLPEVR